MSSVSRAMASWRSGLRCSRVRMLCSRSASLISTTRTSVTMASSILRTFSAWRSSRLANWILSILVTPSTMWATWSPKPGFDLFAGGGRVLHGVVQQAGSDGRCVHLHLGENLGHFKRMNDVRLAGGAHLALMMLHAEIPRFADQTDIFTGSVGLNVAEEGLETQVDGMPLGGEQARRIEPRSCRGGACEIGLGGLADCRHTSL